MFHTFHQNIIGVLIMNIKLATQQILLHELIFMVRQSHLSDKARAIVLMVQSHLNFA